jgi:hypothetical protein
MSTDEPDPRPIEPPPTTDSSEAPGGTLTDERPGRSRPTCTGVRRARESWRD